MSTVRYYSGLDLGRSGEFTALAVLERTQPPGVFESGCLSYAVRHLERFPPGTPYPDVFARLATLFAKAPLAGSHLIADQTAVGRPVVEALKRSDVGASVTAATVTAGHAAARDERGGWLVPKVELVGTLQVLLQSGRLKLAEAAPESATLVRELAAFRAEVGGKPDELSWRERDRDDLVFALAVAAWLGERHGPSGGGGVPQVFQPVGWLAWDR
jgi:hypothetical protein